MPTVECVMRRIAITVGLLVLGAGCESDPTASRPATADGGNAEAARLCERQAAAYGGDAELVAAFGDAYEATCWIDGEVAKSPPPGPRGSTPASFNRVVLRVSSGGDVTTVKAGYRDKMPVEHP